MNDELAVRIYEVGPRDGLQNEPEIVPTDVKVAFIRGLADAGIREIEATSFVSPRAVPQLSDAADVMDAARDVGARLPVLVPNERGMDRAVEAGCSAFAVFTAATDAFAQANVRATIEETMSRFTPIADRCRKEGWWLRGYVSVALGCPYSGLVPAANVVDVARRLFELGCDEVALADTIGVGTPAETERLLDAFLDAGVPADRLALHLHDTGGRALANVEVGLRAGIRRFDAAAGGLGGCPFAPSAPGNLSTEALVLFLHERDWPTGLDVAKLRSVVGRLRSAVPSLAERIRT